MGAIVEGNDVGELWNGLRETEEETGLSSIQSLFPASDGTTVWIICDTTLAILQ